VGTLQLHDIFSGEFEEALLTNYHVDLEWMISECPRLIVCTCAACLACICAEFGRRTSRAGLGFL
jgi:hypothetical protein